MLLIPFLLRQCVEMSSALPWNSLAGNQFLCQYLKDFPIREEFEGCWGSGGGGSKVTDLEHIHLFIT